MAKVCLVREELYISEVTDGGGDGMSTKMQTRGNAGILEMDERKDAETEVKIFE